MTVYDVCDVIKRYPRQATPANDGISLHVAPGEIFGLLGDNGAGKTTLVKQMANLLAPSAGSIRLFGQPLGIHPLYTPSQIGYMPQQGMALNNLTAGETLYFTAHLRGLSRRDARAERDHLLDLLDLGPARDRMPPRISGGQRRLLMLAVTIAAAPPVVAHHAADRAGRARDGHRRAGCLRAGQRRERRRVRVDRQHDHVAAVRHI